MYKIVLFKLSTIALCAGRIIYSYHAPISTVYTLQVCFLRFFLNGTTEADFSPRIDEFEAVIGESLYVAVQKNIMLYYTAMVAEIQHVPSETM